MAQPAVRDLLPVPVPHPGLVSGSAPLIAVACLFPRISSSFLVYIAPEGPNSLLHAGGPWRTSATSSGRQHGWCEGGSWFGGRAMQLGSFAGVLALRRILYSCI